MRLKLFRRKSRDRELAEEIEAHLSMAARDRIERGEEPEAAEMSARREFGNRALVQEVTRDMWGWRSLERLWQDARYALRGMRRNRTATAVIVASLALGIGANTAIFSLIDAVMLRMLPVQEPGRLVELLFKAPRQAHFNLFSWRSYDHYRDHNDVFAGVIAFDFEPFSVRAEGLEPEVARGLWVSGNYFAVLGVRPALGRLIAPDDGQPGAPANVVALSWPFWKSRFNLDSGVIGRRIVINGKPATIAGVTPRGFMGMEPESNWDIFVPIAMEPMLHRSSNIGTTRYWLKLAARLKPGVSIEQARAEMPLLFRWTQDDEFKHNDDRSIYDWKIEVQQAGSGLSHVRDRFAKPSLVLMSVVALLLLIACANVAGLLLARGAARQREIALRMSLGASRRRLFRQALTESVLLSAAGAGLGIFLAYAGAAAVVRIIASSPEGIHLQAKPDLTVLTFTAAVALLTGILFGLAPAWQAIGYGPAAPLREKGASGETKGRRALGRALVIAQVALSMALLTAAGLFEFHLSDLELLNLGFRRDHLLLVSLEDSNSGYDATRLSQKYEELLQRLDATPGVRSASICAFYPESGVGAMRPANVEGYQARPGERRFLSEQWVAPRYFETLGIALLMGRDFRFEDRGHDGVAIVNRALVRYFFGDGNPLGRHIRFDGDQQQYEIVGVVADTKTTDARMPVQRTVYFNTFQSRSVASNFALRTTIDPDALASEVRAAVRTSLKTVSVGRIRTMSEQVDSAIVPERLLAMLSGFFGALGAGLAALGLYGLLAYAIARRRSEIGIRVALGATRRDIIRMVAREALALLCAGLVVGIPIAYQGKRLAAGLFPGLAATSPAPVEVAALLMMAVAFVAACVPAYRAARVNPLEALRYE